MTDNAVSQLTALTGANVATGDLLYIVDISEAAAADRSKKITAQELQNYLKKFPATIGVGGATPAASGVGISFPATISASSDANTLDDYEEGTWTTVIDSEVNVTSVSATTTKYIKIGKKVTVFARFAFTVTTANTYTYWRISLPITNSAGNDSAGSVAENLQGRVGVITPYGGSQTEAYIIFPAASSVPSGANSCYISYTYQSAD